MGFKVLVNGELVKEFDGDHQLVDTVSLNSIQGEETSMKVSNDVSQINVIVNVRNAVESNYLDLEALKASRERSTKIEEASKDLVAEGRKKQADMDKAAADERAAIAAAAAGTPVEAAPEAAPTETPVVATSTKPDKSVTV